MNLRRFAATLAVLLLPADAVFAEYVGRTPPRVSLVEGEVSFWRAGSAEWEPAQVNLPLAAGDFLETGTESRLEIQVGGRGFARAASDTQLAVEAHQGSLLRLSTSRGRIALDLRDLAAGTQIDVETPHGKLAVSEPGYYDVTVGPERASFAARRQGRAVVFVGGEVLDLFAGMEVTTGDSVRFARGDAPPPDDWYFWNIERTDRIVASSSRAYVSEDVYGMRDLDDHGDWRDTREYGRVWVPANVAPSWAPYTTGRWLYDSDYGWSWVDSAPWGWAPYHYGRWVWLNSYWGWAPGPVVVAPVYYPALVGFFGGGSVGVSVGIGFPFVSWVALGWGEPIYPWWGPSWYRGQPCWNGWGGPTIINNIYVNNDRGHPGHGKPGKGGGRHLPGRDGAGAYRNQDVPHAVVAARRNDFGRRSFEPVRLDEKTRGRLLPARGSLPVEPHQAGVRQVRQRTHPPRLDAAAVRAAQGSDAGGARRLPERPAPGPSVRERERRTLEPPRRPLSGAQRVVRRAEDAFARPDASRPHPERGTQRPERGVPDAAPRLQEAATASERPAPVERPIPPRSVEEQSRPEPRRIEPSVRRDEAPRPDSRPSRPLSPAFQMRQGSGGSGGGHARSNSSAGAGARQALNRQSR